MFKIWKSLFKINMVRKMKIERFECFLYGRLIALLLSSCIVFTTKEIIYVEEKKEISEIKAFGIVYEYFEVLREKVFQSEIVITKILYKIFRAIQRYGKKSKRKDKKKALFILKSIQIELDELEKIA